MPEDTRGAIRNHRNQRNQAGYRPDAKKVKKNYTLETRTTTGFQRFEGIYFNKK